MRSRASTPWTETCMLARYLFRPETAEREGTKPPIPVVPSGVTCMGVLLQTLTGRCPTMVEVDPIALSVVVGGLVALLVCRDHTLKLFHRAFSPHLPHLSHAQGAPLASAAADRGSTEPSAPSEQKEGEGEEEAEAEQAEQVRALIGRADASSAGCVLYWIAPPRLSLISPLHTAPSLPSRCTHAHAPPFDPPAAEAPAQIRGPSKGAARAQRSSARARRRGRRDRSRKFRAPGESAPQVYR
jgi:hypothetical protein